MAAIPAHFAVHDDENIAALDSKLGSVVRCAHARRLQREPDINAGAPGAPDDAVVIDGHGGIPSAAYHAVPSRGAIGGSTIPP